MLSEVFPTDLASKLGEQFGLLIEKPKPKHATKAMDLNDRMILFQSMAINSTFEDCILNYAGIELSDEQLSVLKLIHRITRQSIRGAIVHNLYHKMEVNRMADDNIDAIKTLIQEIDKREEQIKMPKGAQKQGQGVTLKSTRKEKAEVKSLEEEKKKRNKTA